MSEHKREYDLLKGLLNGQQVHTLTSEQIQSVILGKSSVSTQKSTRLYVLHDGCDIRKPSSSDLAYLGRVLSLDKQVISGYKSMNSIAIDPESQSLDLVFHELYSDKHPDFVSQEILSDPSLQSSQQSALIESGKAINTKIVYKKSIQSAHDALKLNNESVILTHISDREFDDEDYFDYIDQLGDQFITRLKLSRLSNEAQTVLTPKGKVSKRLSPIKLIEKRSFANQSEYCLLKLNIKDKVYHKATVRIGWEVLILNSKKYWVLRICLFDKDKKAIFDNPMLLITNTYIDSLATAIEMYHAYLMRFKIEVVFKFLKQNLGLETIQIRDWESIKNLIALVFFLVGYFKELEEQLKNHPLANFIVSLAFSKGKVTQYFLLKGIEKLANFIEVAQMLKQNNISQIQIDELFTQLGIQIKNIRSY
jgi:hypothetical protein